MVETLIKIYNKKKNSFNHGNKEWEQVKVRAITWYATLQPIYDTINNQTNKKIDRNISNYNTSNNSSDFKRLKSISFSINNQLSYFE